MKEKINTLEKTLNESKKIAIFAHEFADGDAIGSSLGF
jgi:nanoRNase/pAp phosphatase (c-di-AMP/oligoRNAs hydrolase)